jgi:aldose 1-epimerase
VIGDFPGIAADKPFVLGAEEPDIDHCFIMDPTTHTVPIDTRRLDLRKLVSLSLADTNLHLEIFSTEPAFQFYTGKYIEVDATEHTPTRGPRSGLCVEPSRYINAINVPEWRDQVLLEKGEVYGARTLYKAWKA